MVLPTTYDDLFRRQAGHLPVAFLRALSKKESNMNPREANGPAWGLMQVVPIVLSDYNRRKGTNYARIDLLDPEVNVSVAGGLISRIVTAYGKHPDPNMKEDWLNPEFVKLVLAGWNSGYSEAGGVGKVARYLEARGIPVTHDSVFAYARTAKGTPNLSNTAKQRWQRGVAALYYTQPDAGQAGWLGGSTSGFLVKVGVATVLGLVIAKYVMR